VRAKLKWNDPSAVVELEGRHDVRFGMHIHWRDNALNSEEHWSAYKGEWFMHLVRTNIILREREVYVILD
jgi:hypothetical protein